MGLEMSDTGGKQGFICAKLLSLKFMVTSESGTQCRSPQGQIGAPDRDRRVSMSTFAGSQDGTRFGIPRIFWGTAVSPILSWEIWRQTPGAFLTPCLLGRQTKVLGKTGHEGGINHIHWSWPMQNVYRHGARAASWWSPSLVGEVAKRPSQIWWLILVLARSCH
jgi:hypothetical protein